MTPAPVTLWGQASRRGTVPTRVLVSYAEGYRFYREAIAAGIGLLRPHTEVRTAAPTDLGAELGRFGPQLVVCGSPGWADPGDVLAWVELPAGVGRPARIRVGDSKREAFGLTLEGLLEVLDETEEHVGAEAGGAAERGLPGPIYPTS